MSRSYIEYRRINNFNGIPTGDFNTLKFDGVCRQTVLRTALAYIKHEGIDYIKIVFNGNLQAELSGGFLDMIKEEEL